jgi:hypothetical protein
MRVGIADSGGERIAQPQATISHLNRQSSHSIGTLQSKNLQSATGILQSTQASIRGG